ncbi:MAG: hypothetical protein V1914_04365 [archaeon]
MLGKRGQSEDFFADLIPAIVIIVIALVIGTAFSIFYTGIVDEEIKISSENFNGGDIFALLHGPVEGYGNVAHLLTVIADGYAGGSEILVPESMVRIGSEYSECGEEFESVVEKFFVGEGWIISIVEVVGTDVVSEGRVIFKCDHMNTLAEPAILVGTGMHWSEVYLPSSGFTAYKVLVGWKDE